MERDTMSVADRQAREMQHRRFASDPEELMYQFKLALRFRSEHRDMNESVGSAGGFFVPQQFNDNLIVMLKQVDRLFDPDVVLSVESDNGGPMQIPIADPTGLSAFNVSEGQQSTEKDLPTSNQLLPLTPLWRSGMTKASIELIQDSGYPLDQVLTKAFTIAMARGIGAANVTKLLSQATVARVATGSSGNTGGSETGGTSVGSDDLEALLDSVDPAYRMSPKCRWLMNNSTKQSIFSIKDKMGRPIYKPWRNAAGETLLLDYPIAICPSMPSIGLSATSIAFGDIGYFVVRIVKNSMRVSAYTERFADYGQVGYAMWLRSNSVLAVGVNSDSPVKLLENAAS